ncbi:MAG TPA: PKD domain-containing protein [Vicinamibacterales bacterium]|jgi:PKD repeat protein
MDSTNNNRFMMVRAIAVFCMLAVAAGCTVSKQDAPPLSGPSGFGLIAALSATPEAIPRDGASRSIINVDVRNNEQPYANKVLIVATDIGTVSSSQIVTDNNGHATFFYTAPDINDPSVQATISVTPLRNGDVADVRTDSIRVALLGPDVPVPAFTFLPGSPAQFQEVTFNASTTTLGGAICNGNCSYSWDFGDGSDTASGQSVKHRFQTQGIQVVKLTVTSLLSGASASRSNTVDVGPPVSPTALLTFSPTDPQIGDTVNFDASASKGANGATIVEYRWNFGGGSGSTSTPGPLNTATFPAERTYVVTLTVVDSNGQTATTSMDVAVKAAAP